MEPPAQTPGQTPRAAPTPAGTALGLLSIGMCVGLLGGLGLASWWHGRYPKPAPAGTAAQSPELLEGLQRLESAANRVGDAAEKLAGAYERSGAPAPRRVAAAPPREPGGRLVAWLPAEGVPRAKAWFARKLQAELTDLEAAAADPRSRVGAKATDAQVGRATKDWKARAETLIGNLEALQAVASELQLARWLDETGWGKRPPKAWQLAELAEQLRKNG